MPSEHPGGSSSGHQQARHERISVREEVKQRTGFFGRTIDSIGNILAMPRLFFALLLFHVVWVVVNLRSVESVPDWDPYPFAFLATIASALAPFFSLLILMRQHRDARIAELREELSLQISLETERKTALLMRMLDDLRVGLHLETRVDLEEIERGKQMLRPEDMLDTIRAQLDEAEGDRMTS